MFQNFTVPVTVQLALLTLLVGFFVRFMIQLGSMAGKYLESVVPPAKMALVKAAARTIVRSLIQAPQFQDYENSDKKTYALLYVINAAEKAGFEVLTDAAVVAANSVGLTLTHKDIDAIVEEAYGDAKAELIDFAGLSTDTSTVLAPGSSVDLKTEAPASVG